MASLAQAFNVLSAIIKQRTSASSAQYKILDIRDMEVCVHLLAICVRHDSVQLLAMCQT